MSYPSVIAESGGFFLLSDGMKGQPPFGFLVFYFLVATYSISESLISSDFYFYNLF